MSKEESDSNTKKSIRGILKSNLSVDDTTSETSKMIRSESKSQKIPHFDEINLVTNQQTTEKKHEPTRRSSDHQKSDFNEFQIVRQRRKEIEDELRALEQDDVSK